VKEIRRKLRCNREEIGPDCRKYGSENVKSAIVAYECDLLNRDAIREIAKKVEDEIGGIDVLVTCAGQSNEDIFDIASTTLKSHYWVSVS